MFNLRDQQKPFHVIGCLGSSDIFSGSFVLMLDFVS